MRAVGASGGVPIEDPAALRDIEVPVPELRPRDALIAVEAVSVNPVDTKVRDSMDAGEAPRILGYDGAGVVREVGSEVQGFAVGDAVWWAGDITRPGSNAELQAVDERVLAPRPTTLSAAEAAALPLTAITAWESLFDHLALGADSTGTLLVLGAAGGVGSILLQLAATRLPGVRLVATASRPRSREWVQDLGADTVVDHHDLVAATRAVAPDGVDWIFSPHSAGNEAAFAELLRPLGHLVGIDAPETGDLAALKPKSIAWHWQFMFCRSMFETPDMAVQGEMLREVAALVDAGAVRTTVSETIEDFSAAGLRRAHQAVLDGHMVGKVVVSR